MSNVDDIDLKRSNLSLMLSIVVIILIIESTKIRMKVKRKNDLMRLSKLFLSIVLR